MIENRVGPMIKKKKKKKADEGIAVYRETSREPVFQFLLQDSVGELVSQA